jgi:hypothetical protein
MQHQVIWCASLAAIDSKQRIDPFSQRGSRSLCLAARHCRVVVNTVRSWAVMNMGPAVPHPQRAKSRWMVRGRG